MSAPCLSRSPLPADWTTHQTANLPSAGHLSGWNKFFFVVVVLGNFFCLFFKSNTANRVVHQLDVTIQ